MTLSDATQLMEPPATQVIGSQCTQLMEPQGVDLAVELAHDVRSPLGAMIALAETLHTGAAGPLTASQRYQLGLLLQAAKGISRVTTDIIDSARGGSVEGLEAVAPFDVHELLTFLRELAQPMAESAGVGLIVRNHAPHIWLGRKCAVTRVMLNLLTNAFKYTNRGAVEYGARLLSATCLEFFVRDTGVGLLPVPGRPLGGAANHGKRWKGASSGLGLAISRRLLQSMGSTLDVESRPGAGSRFSFALMLRDSV